MMRNQKIPLLLLLLCSSLLLCAQDVKEEIIENLIENLAENSEEEPDYTTLLQELYALYDAPLDINEAAGNQLEVLPMLSAIDITNLLNYRKQVGKIYTIYELKAVKGFTPEILSNLQHFITFESREKSPKQLRLKDMLRYSSNSLMLRGQRIYGKQYGYSKLKVADFESEADYEKWQNRRYLGSPWRYYVRYETRYRSKLKVGIVAEKDPGEEFFRGTQKRGFDHYTGFVQINDIGILKTAIVGDYTPRFGQGLAVWSGYSMGKSGYFLHVNKTNEGLKKYASSNENEYMRGVGLTVEPLHRLQLTAYYSQKKIDGNLTASEELEDEAQRFTSFLNSGYHRSHNELAKRKTIGEKILGANANFVYNNLKLGVNLIDYRFSKPFANGNSLSNLYDFSGKHGQNYSAYASYRYERLYFFGEAAFDKQQAGAWVGGIVFNADEQLNFSMVYRDYAKEYQALYASGFGDKSETQNERGWYIGMEMLPLAKWKLSAYFDMYEFPWLRNGIDAPARGYDYKIRLAYRHSRKMSAYVQFYQEKNEKNTSQADSKLHFLVNENRTKVRAHIDYQILPNLRFKDRVSLSFYKKEAKDYQGFVIFHDIVYRNSQLPVSFSARYALFDVEDYQARIYTYENDILYAFSTPALQNRGFRFYYTAKWDINQHFTLWAKYAITRYSDRETISSGLNLLQSNRTQELKLQLRYKF